MSAQHTPGSSAMFEHRALRIAAIADQLPASLAAALVGAREDTLTIRLTAGVNGGTVRGLRNRSLVSPETKALTPLGREVRAAIAKAKGGAA